MTGADPAPEHLPVTEPGRLAVCLRCAHRHPAGGECAGHVWGDSCPYDAGADCLGPGLRSFT